MSSDAKRHAYTAKTDYVSQESARGYEKRPHYRGALGRYRKAREVSAIARAVALFEAGSTVLDCHCGNGRWFDLLSTRASRIIARDASPGMVATAGARSIPGLELEVAVGDAEKLDLADASVHHVFSYALMKHLPVPIQYRVLAEFARVSTGRVAVSFALLDWVGFLVWPYRKTPEGYPVARHEIEWMAAEAGLVIEHVFKSGTPLGMESLVVFNRQR